MIRVCATILAMLMAMSGAAEPVKMKAILTVPHEFDMLVKSGHIQGLACSEKGIYLSHQTGLAKIGWDGKLVKHVDAPRHLGGIACANYGGVSLVNPEFTSFKKLKCPSFAEGFALVPKSIAKRETPVFIAVRALGGNMKGWRKDPANNPPRLRLEFYAFDGASFTDITE